MNKNKYFLKAIIGVMSIFSVFSVCSANGNKNKKETVVIEYEYKNKDMDIDKRNIKLKKSKKDENGITIYENKTSEKEILNFYIILNKLFSKFQINKNALKDLQDLVVNPRENIKLTGGLALNLNLKEKENLKKSLNENLTKFKLTKDEFLKFKTEVVNIIKKDIEKIKNLSKEERKIRYGKNKFKQNLNIKKDLNVLEKRIKKFENVKFDDVLKLTKDLKIQKNIKEYGKLLP